MRVTKYLRGKHKEIVEQIATEISPISATAEGANLES